jgi:ABC-type nitrate/sulfonate/bicarbonate transport system permease component
MSAPAKEGRVPRWPIRYASPVAVLAAWELSVRLGLVDPFLLPALSSVLLRAAEEIATGDVLFHTGLTVYRAMTGFLSATVLGVLIGVLTARNRYCRWFFEPLVSVGFPMPKIAFMAIFILWFGIGDASKIVMVTLTCIFPIISATYLGCSQVDHYLVWSARNMGTSERRVLWKVVLPASLPQILNGLQIAFPSSLIVTVVTEMISSGGGLGGYMILAARFALSEKVFVGIVVIAIVGYTLLTVFGHFRRHILAWHAESQMAI